MCTAMTGATPVYWCTWAASSAFSNGSRGTPGWPNTLNRVPLLPNAQDGSSIWWFLRASLTAVRSRIRGHLLGSRASSRGLFSVEVEDLFDPGEGLVRRAAGHEEPGHLGLPAAVDAGRRHRGERGLVVAGFQVADEQAVTGEEDRVVAPAGLAQRGQHLRPHFAVPLAVLVQPVRPDPREEADALHSKLPSAPPRRPRFLLLSIEAGDGPGIVDRQPHHGGVGGPLSSGAARLLLLSGRDGTARRPGRMRAPAARLAGSPLAGRPAAGVTGGGVPAAPVRDNPGWDLARS